MIIRKYDAKDCKFLSELFYNTVHTINAKDYTAEQLNAWAPEDIDPTAWNKSFSESYTVTAIEKDVIVGFGNIDKTGYLDMLYVHKDYQNHGIASAICSELENAVEASKIITHASITAKSFFMNRGYTVVKEQQVARRGILLTNFVMELLRENRTF